MNVKRFEVPGLAQYSYIVSSGDQAVVIDPIRDIDTYLRYVAENHLTITHILETHIHADFASGSLALAAATGAQLALSAYDAGELYQYAMPHTRLQHDDNITVGTVTLRALHTPGHTPEHLSFLASESGEPIALFTGDFLFVGSLGRPDLLGAAATQRLAHLLFRSVNDTLRDLPGTLAIYPGHGAGSFCGSNMGSASQSTLASERSTNEWLSLDEPAFLAKLIGTLPPLPAYYPRMKALNAAGAPILNALPGAAAFSVEQVRELSTQPDVTLLDLRSLDAFAAAHIPTSLAIGYAGSLSLWTGWLLDPTSRIILIGDGSSDEESARGKEEPARKALIRVGLDNILGHLDGGIAAWRNANLPLSSIGQLSAEQVLGTMPALQILDVREDTEWRTGNISSAHHIPLGDLPKRIATLSANLPTVTICESGYRAGIAASLLAASGFQSVFTMTEGMSAWKRAKLPLISKLSS